MWVLCSVQIKVIAFSVSSRQLLLLKGSSIWDAVSDLCEMSKSWAHELGSRENARTGFVEMSAFSWVNEEG